MTNKISPKTDMRSVIVVFSIVAMLVGSFGFKSADAAASPISLSSDISSADIMEGEDVYATLTITNSDTTFRVQEVKLNVIFPSGIAWNTEFLDTDNEPIEDNLVAIGKNDDALNVLLRIECVGACSAGDTNQVRVYGQSDPKWFPGGTNPDTCGSSNCLTDTNPASGSNNVTNVVSIDLTARTGGAHTVACDSASNSGSNEMFHGITYQWGYDLTNTGWNDDTYTFTTSVNNGDITDWTFNAGLSNKALTGQSDTSSTAVHSAEASMEIKPSDSARPGVYKLGLQVTGTSSGIVEGCEFNVVIKQPDLEVKDTDISFSHSSAWINSRGDSQRVTITAMVRNNGGIVDTEGVKVENIEVIFLVDGSQLGSVVTIDSLAYGEEKPVSVTWNPGRAHDSNEVGIPIKVSVDPSFDIQESDADNNIASTHFKVVKTKASNPSFYMSFLSLVGAVGAAVLMSAYYRNKDEE
ncbi:MAG: CARDB domain-containing protein [Candidatus Thermoplasmatota archaeon]|nr:CARDB domain-containing protein [Candidatus Thermoplasmatota archaeon]